VYFSTLRKAFFCLDRGVHLIEMVERGSTEINLRLPMESGEKLVRAVEARDNTLANSIASMLGSIALEEAEDRTHSLKRMLSFALLDGLLDSCMGAECPKLNPDMHYYLINISAEGYILEETYHLSIEGVLPSERDRYSLARERVTRMFTCPVMQPSLDSKIFELDKVELMKNMEAATRRKAYWRYLSNRDEDAAANYFAAARLLEDIQHYEALGGSTDVCSLIEMFARNLSVVSASELYKICYIRQCTNQRLPTSTMV